MKRTTLAVTALGSLALGALQPALAATAPKPVKQTMYLHGTSVNGNQDNFEGTALTLDAKKPTGSSDKDMVFFGAAASPNTDCAGGLLPYWSGALKGTLTGKITVNFYARSTPGATAVVQVFKDAGEGGCNELNPGAFAEVVVDLKAGATNALHTAVIPVPGKVSVKDTFHVQVAPGTTQGLLIGPQVSGIGYDSTVSPSNVVFTCTPLKGKKTC
jgi:hypothetical protein